ncbi:GNAT family N-acetyltransferase [Arachnia propionica]|uniref:GNAT family N-acetyltransferase n=1 Tax=Arachnia propionica TaxID=1750 RepID=A0A3P1T226_9ACTN|nr:GNAT family N-acetyltransferase [Arachnia propionica]RRD03409.1 GNAT family N-acetyltransferase [Arachnia propionica]
MGVRVRVLGPQDVGHLQEFLAERPVENLFFASKIAQSGMSRRSLGLIHGFERDGVLTAACLDGGTLFPAGADPEAIAHFVEAVGKERSCASILGNCIMALGVYLGLSTRFRGSWTRVVNVRRRQPLMVLTGPPRVAPDPRVRLLGMRDFESYLAASVAMYTDEIGVSPFKYGPGYGSFVRSRLELGDAWGVVENGRVIFKADIGPRFGNQTQLQGVWLDPSLRGQGHSAALLSGMLLQVQQQFPVVSLYVNDFNTPAIRVYEKLGFQEVGSLATVHY